MTVPASIREEHALRDTLRRAWQADLTIWTLAEATRHRALMAIDGTGSSVLCVDRAPDPLMLEAVELRLGRGVRWQIFDADELSEWLGEAGQRGRALAGVQGPVAEAVHEEDSPELSLLTMEQAASPAVRLLDAVLHDALKDGASDVHFEMRGDGAEVRIRLDGVMLPMQRVGGRAVAEQMVSRLKVMAELDIGERRLPQDGRFTMRADGRPIDFRLSILPSVHGEDAVVRVLDRRAVAHGEQALTLAALGFGEAQQRAILAQAGAPHGMLLVTGPTGSGKTTTLYAAISEIHRGTEKIITIEDPVEYELAGVVQIPVNERKGLGFARGLRSILRHDPDRVLVGEIRDPETAQIAVQAALTGHLVFSTVHANHTFDVMGRFSHMGLDVYNVVTALNAVVAQRLVRRLCGDCAEPLAATEAADRLGRLRANEGDALELAMNERPLLRRAVGCARCRGTGYRGRQAVAEMLVFDDALRDLVAQRAPMQQVKAAARARGLRPLRQEALALALAGVTTSEELDRVVAAD